MEKIPNPENIEREAKIDKLVEEFAESEGMSPEDVLIDMMTYSSHEGNEDPNPVYFEIVAEKMGISPAELEEYAVKKWNENMAG